MSVSTVCHWLGETSASIALGESRWMYPIVETLHVLSLCLFVGLVAILDLRLVGAIVRWIPVSDIQHRLFPWTMAGFALMVISGLLLFFGEPMRFYGNVFFRVKVVLLTLAGLNAGIFHRTVYRRIDGWDRDIVAPRSARLAGALSLALWTSIIVAGRLIAYNWFDK